jgi:SSS family solute:Na+ symporter
MTVFDYLTLVLYVCGLFVISTLAARRTSDSREMFAAGRSSPWWAAGLSGFMTMFSAGTFVVWGGIAYEQGLVAVTINSCYGVAALLAGYWVAGRWNALGVSTPAEFVQLRFGKTGLHFFTWAMLIKRILGVSVSLYALAVLLVALMPVDLTWAIVVFGGIVILYTMQGGLWAVLMTDVLQFLVLTVVVLMVAMLMLTGMDLASFSERVPSHFFDPVSARYGWFFLVGWVTIHFFIIGAEWAFVQRFLAVRSPGEARKSAYLFGVMYLLTPLFWMLPPLLYRSQVAGVDKEQAYILAAQSVLPPGMVGLMFAAMFSATASMVSSQLNVFAGVLTHDFYRPFLKPLAGENELVRVGRIFTFLLGVLLVVTALLVPRLGGAEQVIISINSLLVVPLFAPTLWGMFSQKIGIRDMLTVALSSFFVGLTLRFGVAENPGIGEGSWLWPLASLLSRHAQHLEMICGVLLPVMMLFGFELCKRGVDEGALRVERHRAGVGEQVKCGAPVFDPLAARMVMFSLLILGFWIIILSLIGVRNQVLLFGFGLVLVLVAAGIQRWILRVQQELIRNVS